MLQVREQEVLAGPQIAHSGSRCVWAGTKLVDHLRGRKFTFFSYAVSVIAETGLNGEKKTLFLPGSRALPDAAPAE